MKTAMYIICTVIIIGVSAYLFYIQTDNKSKIFMVLVSLWILGSAYINLHDHFVSTPKPKLIWAHMESKYSGNPINSASFAMHMKNTGNAKALEIKTKPIIYINDEIFYKDETSQPDLEPGQTAAIRFALKGETFQKIWNRESKLRVNLSATYKGDAIEAEAEYDVPEKNGFNIEPSWKITKN